MKLKKVINYFKNTKIVTCILDSKQYNISEYPGTYRITEVGVFYELKKPQNGESRVCLFKDGELAYVDEEIVVDDEIKSIIERHERMYTATLYGSVEKAREQKDLDFEILINKYKNK